MFFFPQLESTAYSLTDLEYAKLLAKAVKKATKVQQAFSTKTWAEEFAILGRMLEGDQQRLKTVLEWFCIHITDRYTPQAYSAKTFRTKFAQIERVMQIQQEKNPQVEVSALAYELLQNHIGRLPWGNGNVEQLPVAIQRTLDEREKSLQALQQFLTSLDSSVQQVARSVKEWFKDPDMFTLVWFAGKAKRYGKWEQWNGDFIPLTYTHGCEDFINAVLNASRKWEHRTKTGVLILNKMGVQHGS